MHRSENGLYTGAPTAPLSRTPLWLPLLSSALVFFACLLVLAWLANWGLREQVRDGKDKLLTRFDHLAEESVSVLERLNQMEFTRCDERTLVAMRRTLFDARYVTDISFLQNDRLMCSVWAGVLEQPLALGAPDFVSSQHIEVWVRQQLPLLLFGDRFISAFEVRKDAFKLVIAYQQVAEPVASVPFLQWEMVYLGDAQPVRLAGYPGLYQLNDQTPTPYGGYHSACSELTPRYCVAVRLPLTAFLVNHRVELTLALLLSLLLAVVSYYLVRAHMYARRSIAVRVRRGLRRGHFYWHYQPIVELKTGRWIGCEALARFQDHYGRLTPDKFIPVLRHLGLTWAFTEVMVERVLTELGALSVLPDSFKVSLNICPTDIENGRVEALPTLPAVQANRLTVCLEITEDEYLDAPAAHARLSHLSQQGFALSIDDFGTGYSNLKDLAVIQFDHLKIDRSFVSDIATKGVKTSMIPHIVELARQFGCCTVAEGVETAEQEQILRASGVQLGQGWRYGKPMSAAALSQAFPSFNHTMKLP